VGCRLEIKPYARDGMGAYCTTMQPSCAHSVRVACNRGRNTSLRTQEKELETGPDLGFLPPRVLPWQYFHSWEYFPGWSVETTGGPGVWGGSLGSRGMGFGGPPQGPFWGPLEGT